MMGIPGTFSGNQGSRRFQVENRTFLKRIDWNFAGAIFALNVIGLINLYSATHGHNDLGTSRLFLSQIFWLFAGWMVYFVVTLVDYSLFVRMAYVIYGLNLMALVAVMFVGKTVLGATRWLDFGIFSYQPSESMKLSLCLILARVMSQRSYPDGLGPKELAFPLIVLIGVPFLVTAEQPDLGTALMLGVIGSSVLFFLKIKSRLLVAVAVALLIGGAGAWVFALRDYQKDRVYTFFDPGRDPRGRGYNSIQSKIAVGSGKVFGKGFRKGTQSQLEFLPERHTDFIFSVLCEEHGFIGSITTIGLFATLFMLGVRVASQARDKSGAILAVGILSILFWHQFINIGMVIGLLPIVGVPLPLLSYGGSNMLTTMAALGLVSSVSYRKHMF
jgi:rod shape determining protein RodA